MAKKEYIEREAVNDLIKAECSPKVTAYLIDAVATVPAADVRPVVRGKWVDEPIKGIRYYCSVCQGRFDYTWHYCPNCGADMRGNNG